MRFYIGQLILVNTNNLLTIDSLLLICFDGKDELFRKK